MTCSRMLILYEGKILAADTPENLQRLMDNTSRIVAEIAAPEIELQECWAQMPEIEQFDVSPADGEYFRCALTPRDGDRPAAAHLRADAGAGLVFAGADPEPAFAGRHLRAGDAAGRGGGGLMQAYWTLTRRELCGVFPVTERLRDHRCGGVADGFSFCSLLKSMRGLLDCPCRSRELFYRDGLFLADPAAGGAGDHDAAFWRWRNSRNVRDADDHAGDDCRWWPRSSPPPWFSTWPCGCRCSAACCCCRHYIANRPRWIAGCWAAPFSACSCSGARSFPGLFASSLTRKPGGGGNDQFAVQPRPVFHQLSSGPRLGGRNGQSQVLSFFALRDQMNDFARGVVDTRPVVFYLSMTFFFLFLTLACSEAGGGNKAWPPTPHRNPAFRPAENGASASTFS